MRSTLIVVVAMLCLSAGCSLVTEAQRRAVQVADDALALDPPRVAVAKTVLVGARKGLGEPKEPQPIPTPTPEAEEMAEELAKEASKPGGLNTLGKTLIALLGTALGLGAASAGLRKDC